MKRMDVVIGPAKHQRRCVIKAQLGASRLGVIQINGEVVGCFSDVRLAAMFGISPTLASSLNAMLELLGGPTSQLAEARATMVLDAAREALKQFVGYKDAYLASRPETAEAEPPRVIVPKPRILRPH